jgi:hypothetical protein
MMDHWFRSTGTPALVAKCEHAAAMLDPAAGGTGRTVPPPPSSGSGVGGDDTKTIVAVRRPAT